MRCVLLFCAACGSPQPHGFMFERGELDQAGPPTAIDETLVLQAPVAAEKGGIAHLRVSGAAPGQLIRIAGSYVGVGTSTICPTWLNRNCIDLQTVGRVAEATADANGDALIIYDVPSPAADRVYLQALARRDAATRLLPNKSAPISVRLDDYDVPVDRVLMSHLGNILEFDNPSGVSSTLATVSDLIKDFGEGPDGLLYIAAGDRVIRHDAVTGAYVDDFVAEASGGLSGAETLAFGPDGHLYVGSFFTQQILRYDGLTGDFIDVFVDSIPTHSDLHWAEGDLYVAGAGNNRVVARYDGITGDPIETINIGLTGSYDIAYRDGLWVLNATTASVARYYDSDWNFIGDVGTDYFTAWGAFIRGGELFIADPSFDKLWVYGFPQGTLRRSFVGPGGTRGYGMPSF